MKKNKLLFIMILLLAGCGYRFAGELNLPEGVKTVSISLFENRTGETGLENELTNAFIHEFTRNRCAVINQNQAEAHMSGLIYSVLTEIIAHKGIHISSEQRVIVKINVILKAKDGRILWSGSKIDASQAFEVVNADKPTTEQNRQAAITYISKLLAEKVFNRLSADF